MILTPNLNDFVQRVISRCNGACIQIGVFAMAGRADISGCNCVAHMLSTIPNGDLIASTIDSVRPACAPDGPTMCAIRTRSEQGCLRIIGSRTDA